MISFLQRVLISLAGLLLSFGCASAQPPQSMKVLFSPEGRNAKVMQIEAAIAIAQSESGVIPKEAADEISAKSDISYAPLDDVSAEYDRVRHRMVALLNVWRRSLSEEASDALHKGVTTVDVYDTVLVLQLLESIDIIENDLLVLEDNMLCLAHRHRETPMMGRTLGQHALPITFGKKVAVWAAQTRRNIERLSEVRARLKTSGTLKGAVGSHLGLGPDGVKVEMRVSEILKLDPPEPADWRPARDVFAEYAQVLALIAKSQAAVGGEIFRLQMTDVGELYEKRSSNAVGSSTMPHKRNPSLSEALIYQGRTIPALSDIILQDVESVFERDNTSRPNRTLEEISLETADMLNASTRLIDRLVVDVDRMRSNMDRTDGRIMSQRIMLHLGQKMSREEAEARLREISADSLISGQSFRQALLEDAILGPKLVNDIDDLLNPENALGLAATQVDRTRSWIAQKRSEAGQVELNACSR